MTPKFITLLFLAVVINCSNAFSQLIFRDDFSYPVSNDLSGQGGWFNTGVTSVNKISVVSPGLVYAGYNGSNIGNTALLKNIYPGDILLKNYTPQTSGSIYYSFLIRVDSLGGNTTGLYATGLDESGPSTNFNTLLNIRKVNSSTFKFGFTGKPESSDTFFVNTYNLATTYLIVLKYTYVSGAANNDTSGLFIFTSGVPATEPAPLYTSTTGLDITSQGQILLNSNDIGGNNAFTKIKIDGIRVGKTWATSVLSSVQQLSNEVPGEFKLWQNYPNPFNPVTNLEFGIKEPGFVSLKVFDLLGKEAAVLVNEKLSPGKYKTEFNGGNLSSGMYFYKLETENFVETRRMMLVK